jgi:pentatricopeptide repeat protein
MTLAFTATKTRPHQVERRKHSLPEWNHHTTSLLFLASSSPTGGDNSNNNNNNSDKTSDNRRLQSLQRQFTTNPLISLNLNLDSLAQMGAASRAQELLQRIQALYQEGYYEASPDIISYNSVLKAWKEYGQPEKALELLEHMMMTTTTTSTTTQDEKDSDRTHHDTVLSGDTSIQVDVISFNTVMAAFAEQGNYPRCIDLLRQMQTNDCFPNPDTITYNVVLYSLARSSDRGTAAQAEIFLREMMMLQQQSPDNSNVSVVTISFNTCIYAWSKEKEAYHKVGRGNNNNISDDADPNGDGYTSRDSLDAISTASAYRAYELLTIMEELADAGNINVQPDVYSYTHTIQAFARCRQPQQAQKVLQKMTSRGLQPSRLTYTALTNAFAKGGHPEKASSTLQTMIRAYDQEEIQDLQPDTIAFSSVMDGWAKISSIDRPDAATHALDLLDVMKGRGPACRPNAQTYSSLLTALAKCGTEQMCEKARMLLQEMEDDYQEGDEEVRPTRIQYNGE